MVNYIFIPMIDDTKMIADIDYKKCDLRIARTHAKRMLNKFKQYTRVVIRRFDHVDNIDQPFTLSDN